MRQIYNLNTYWDESRDIRLNFLVRMLERFFTSNVVRCFDISEELPFISQELSDDDLITIYHIENAEYREPTWASILIYRHNGDILLSKIINQRGPYFCHIYN